MAEEMFSHQLFIMLIKSYIVEEAVTLSGYWY